MGVADYSKRQLIKNCKVPHLKSTDLNRIQVTTLTCCNIQVTQHYCTNAGYCHRWLCCNKRNLQWE